MLYIRTLADLGFIHRLVALKGVLGPGELLTA